MVGAQAPTCPVSVNSARLEFTAAPSADVITPLGSGELARWCELRRSVSGKEVVNAVDGVVGDLRKDIAQPRFGINTVVLGGANQQVNRASAFAFSVGIGEHEVTAADGHAAQGPFGSRVVDLDQTVRTVISLAHLCKNS